MIYLTVGYYKPKLKNIKLLKEYFKKQEKQKDSKQNLK